MSYLLDANAFIQAKQLHYGFDFCPAYWDWLDRGNAAGSVYSVDAVHAELRAGGDDLSEWADARPDLFLSPDDATVPSLRALSDWAEQADYDSAAVNTFLQVGDYYLVAQAHARGDTVVTHEVHRATRKKIQIPDACIGMGIRCMSPYAMLSAEGARFVLAPTAG